MLGKPETATIKLSVALDTDTKSFTLSISDDGAGINKSKIFNKALKEGLVDKEAKLADHDIHDLIFHKGSPQKMKYRSYRERNWYGRC